MNEQEKSRDAQETGVRGQATGDRGQEADGKGQKPPSGPAVSPSINQPAGPVRGASSISPPGESVPVSPVSHHPSPGSRPFRVGAVILAAGASTRMGELKQLLLIEGKPLLLRAVEAALESPVWPVVVVLGAHAERIRPVLAPLPVLITENPAWPEGMAASIRAGVTTLQQFSRRLDAALIALCDQPAFSAGIITQLLNAQRTTGRSIVAAHYAGRNGAPALFLREHFATLVSLTGEEGARALLNGAPDQVASVDLPSLAHDLDTPADVTAFGATTEPGNAGVNR